MKEFYRPVLKLRCSPWSWLKWQYLCHAGPTEVAGFGLSAQHDPLYLEDILVIGQHASAATVAFDDAAVADLFDRMTDLQIAPHRFARVWLHTHPGSCAKPSGVDEATFARVFGSCDWSVMAILSRTSSTYARLQFSAGPGGSLEIPVAVDWQAWPHTTTIDSDFARWREEYEQQVRPLAFGFPDLQSEEGHELGHAITDLFTWGELLEYSQS